ncbi:MAG: type VI secretion system protein TssA [Gemmatirosa sp.]|nr:type VI secretion system protein TssA [Gemmatirosa sp.]
MPVNADLAATLLTPVPGDNPSGKDLRYDPRYDKVKEARREDLDLPQGGLATERKIADWPQVVTLASQLLQKETKDLQLAAWLTEALLKREAFGGLATGLTVLKGLLDGFWETLYPEYDEDDLELRAGPLEWVGGRLDVPVKLGVIASGGTTFLEHVASRAIPLETEENREKKAQREEELSQGKKSPEEVDRAVAGTPKAFYKALVADLDAAQQALAALEVTADERFGRDAPGFGKLRSALDEVRRLAGTILAQKLVLDPDPIVEEPEAADGDGTPTAARSADGAPAGPLAPEPTSAADAGARVASAARFLRSQEPTNPAPYLMLRGLRWGELRATPGDVDAKLLEAPVTAARARLKALLLDGKWSELLEQGEALMATPQGRGWLDLQRYTLTACARLGAPYDAVAAAVRSELRALLVALPHLPEMTLMDDTPTANGETRDWLEAEGLDGSATPSSDDDSAGADTMPGDGSDSLHAALLQDDETAENGGFARPATRRRGTARRAVDRALGDVAADPFLRARAELAQQRPNRAIELLVAELARERSPRGRFVRQTQIAYVMVEAGLFAVARPILEKLVSVVDERTLEDWEAGPLVAQPMALLCRVIDGLEDSYAADQRRELYLRVCRLDPLQAISLPHVP